MKMIVLMKRLPDLVEDLEVDESGRALDTEHLKFTLNEFDDHALEEALLLKESGGGEVTVMALEGEDVDKMLYTALAKGADRAMKITGAHEVASNLSLARIFADLISQQPYDLILTGVQAADDRDGQLGPMVAALLNQPSVEVVTSVTSGDGALTLQKEYSGGVAAEFEVTLPAVLGIQAARQPPRYASVSKVKQIAQTTSIETIEGKGPGDAPQPPVLAMTPPATGGGAQMLEGVGELFAVLESKGIIQ